MDPVVTTFEILIAIITLFVTGAISWIASWAGKIVDTPLLVLSMPS